MGIVLGGGGGCWCTATDQGRLWNVSWKTYLNLVLNFCMSFWKSSNFCCKGQHELRDKWPLQKLGNYSPEFCWFTSRWLKGRCLKWDWGGVMYMGTQSLASLRRPGRWTEAVAETLTPLLLFICVSALNCCPPVSLCLTLWSRKNLGSREFTEIKHISLYYVYKNAFCPPSDSVCCPNHASVYLPCEY